MRLAKWIEFGDGKRKKRHLQKKAKMRKNEEEKYSLVFKIIILPDLVVFSPSTIYFFSEAHNTVEIIYLTSVFGANL